MNKGEFYEVYRYDGTGCYVKDFKKDKEEWFIDEKGMKFVIKVTMPFKFVLIL